MNDITMHHEFSPSKLGRFKACPGCKRMCAGLPDFGSDAADEGTLIHEAIAAKNRSGLNAEQEELFFMCFQFLKDCGINDATKAKLWQSEMPLAVHDDNGTLLTSGTADVVVHQNDGALSVVDWKFGRNPVPSAGENMQLAAYAAGAMEATGADECHAYIYQPRLGMFSDYVFRNRGAIVRNIAKIIARANGTGPLELNAGVHCRYCPAAAICPKIREEGEILSKFQLEQKGAALAALYEKSLVVRKALESIEEAVKAECDEHGSCGDWYWKERAGALECVDIAGLFERVKDTLTIPEIISSMKVTRSKIMEAWVNTAVAIAEAQGEKLTKKDAKARFEEATKGLFEQKAGTRVLVKGGTK